ncbi:hypothetical protein [Sphingomonas profundi]|uniref:hypothetical protein n=1 Tax=Alterirhizorhabdus profundi TaxID=2681549 RepID=UPI0012E6F0E8|nr:hypothetical protein [Sphingomonas profundi]
MDHQLIVLSNATAGEEDAFNLWYDEVHLPDVLAVPGIAAARRFTLAEGAEWRFAAIYDMTGDDPAATVADLVARVADGRIAMTDAFDMASFRMLTATPCGPRRTA